LNGQLKRTHEVLVIEFQNLEAFLMLLSEILDKLIGLSLRVDHKRVATGFIDYDTVFDRCIILGQPCDVPGLDLHRHSHEHAHTHALSVLYLQLLQLVHPALL
jgi:hypothetical protein